MILASLPCSFRAARMAACYFAAGLFMHDVLAYEQGEELMDEYGCYTCHAYDQRGIGPSLQDIAQRYAGNKAISAELARRIIEGTTGAWGDEPMRPHPDLTPAEAEILADYILALPAD